MVDKGRPTARRSKEVEAAKILWDVLRLFLFPVPNEHCRKSQIHRSPSPLSPRSSFANSSRGSCRKYSSNSRFVRDHDERFHYRSVIKYRLGIRKGFWIFLLSFVRSINLIDIDDDPLLIRHIFHPSANKCYFLIANFLKMLLLQCCSMLLSYFERHWIAEISINDQLY